MRRSAFYRRFHAGRSDRPPAELPVLTKAVLMEHFDEISTRSDLRLAEIERYLTDSSPQERSSAGTSGAPRRVRPVAVACSSDKIGLGEFDAQVPDSPNLVPPGWYLLTITTSAARPARDGCS